ncbi:Fur family transcriptional regulator, ferric uptake regulator [Peptoclostridium litorale DSM 5388]|uniref:Ferric uptake regulation protein Fur n=1 Tax=Peptoclostridium litorale DSM 5388 TaxID=1121324 RepID=A0A069RD84_PEPLI|nr:Fur family transcriptional regulator [Peptoclostridium litorale]KDR94185.1 ferric uptake regulation protein Fur [Peptoclostridium litorale DSM 5388]SIN81993.1 Fur family transcriptional regulator, ferric uptake regulator [Peptoclostridium litorale DSM 5388]
MENYFDIIKEKLKAKGFKLTPQRRSIVDTVVGTTGRHLSIEEIYNLVKQSCPEIGLATVYRTVQILDDINVVSKLDLNDGCLRYELSLNNEDDHNHHHLICNNCGVVIEVREDLLDMLEETIEKNYDFKIKDHDLRVFGICKNCK